MTTNPAHFTQYRRLGWRFPGVPVFVYHGLADQTETRIPPQELKYWVLNAQFKEHCDYISSRHFRVSSLQDLLNGKDSGSASQPRVVLTFDDGRASDHRLAFPYLVKSGVKAEFFVNTAKVGAPGFVTWREIAEMQRAGMSFQSHSHDHLDLSRLPHRELGRQLKISKQILEDRLGSSVEFVAPPYGRINREVLEEALQLGYRAVCSARCWPARPGARKLNRVVVYRGTKFHDFQQLMDREPARYLARIARTPLYWLKGAFLGCRPFRFSDGLPEERA
jgi:peptidoglycan/xylan/chitin deacetylase (PgdA/CDA1 family)